MKLLYRMCDLRRPLSGKRYLAIGLLLFSIKYVIDYTVATIIFEQVWHPFVYVSAISNPLFQSDTSTAKLWGAMLVIAVPFVTLGVVLTIRRLSTINLHPAWSLMFFAPFLNVAFFMLLAMWKPIRGVNLKHDLDESLIPRWIPKSKTGALVLSVFPAATGYAVVILAQGWGGSLYYGVGLLVGFPFLTGFTSVALLCQRHTLSYKSAGWFGSIPALTIAALLVVTLVETVVCVLMALPLYLVFSMLGSVIAFAVFSDRKRNYRATFPALTILPIFLAFDLSGALTIHERKVVSTIIIEADAQTVWDNVVSFPDVNSKWEGAFSFYVPTLQRAEIDGVGVGAIRRCVFNQGTFIEPILVWDEPNNLTFGVTAQIKRFETYLEVTRGQFLIREIGDGKLVLTGTTWYRLKLFPNEYWNFWTDAFIHKIHIRALEHIKSLSENNG